MDTNGTAARRDFAAQKRIRRALFGALSIVNNGESIPAMDPDPLNAGQWKRLGQLLEKALGEIRVRDALAAPREETP